MSYQEKSIKVVRLLVRKLYGQNVRYIIIWKIYNKFVEAEEFENKIGVHKAKVP